MTTEKPLTAKHRRILRTLNKASDGTCHTRCLVLGLHASAMTRVRRGLIWKQDRGLARPLYGMHPEGIPAALDAWKGLEPNRENSQQMQSAR